MSTHPPPNKVRPYSNVSTLYIYIYVCSCLSVMFLSVQNVRPLGVIAAGAWHSLPQIYVMYVLVGIVVDLHSRNPMGTLLYVACCHADLGPGLRLLRTQSHSCRRCCSVWPCGWHGMLLCTQPPPVAHCGLTALYAMLYVGLTMLVPLTRKLWGSGPCGITKPLFHSRWKPI